MGFQSGEACPTAVARWDRQLWLVAIAVTKRNSKLRPPEEIMVLGVEAADQGIGAHQVVHRHQPGGFQYLTNVYDCEWKVN